MRVENHDWLHLGQRNLGLVWLQISVATSNGLGWSGMVWGGLGRFGMVSEGLGWSGEVWQAGYLDWETDSEQSVVIFYDPEEVSQLWAPTGNRIRPTRSHAGKRSFVAAPQTESVSPEYKIR